MLQLFNVRGGEPLGQGAIHQSDQVAAVLFVEAYSLGAISYAEELENEGLGR